MAAVISIALDTIRLTPAGGKRIGAGASQRLYGPLPGLTITNSRCANANDAAGYRLPVALPPAATAAAAVSTAAATAAIFFGPGFVDIQRAAIHVAAVQRLDGILALTVVAHFHESKPAGPAGVPVGYDVYAVDRAKFFEHGTNGAFGSVKAKVSYKNVFHLIFFLKFAEQRMRAEKAWIGGTDKYTLSLHAWG
jgi:hypothetical protein